MQIVTDQCQFFLALLVQQDMLLLILMVQALQFRMFTYVGLVEDKAHLGVTPARVPRVIGAQVV